MRGTATKLYKKIYELVDETDEKEYGEWKWNRKRSLYIPRLKKIDNVSDLTLMIEICYADGKWKRK